MRIDDVYRAFILPAVVMVGCSRMGRAGCAEWKDRRESRICGMEGSEGEQVAAESSGEMILLVGCFGFLT